MNEREKRLPPALLPPDAATLNRVAEETTQGMLFALRRALGAAGLHIKDLDQRLGVAKGYCGHLLQGEIHLQISHLVAIAEAIAVPQRALYSEVLPGLSVLTQSAAAPELSDGGATGWWPEEVLLRALVSEILDDLLAEAPAASPRALSEGLESELVP